MLTEYLLSLYLSKALYLHLLPLWHVPRGHTLGSVHRCRCRRRGGMVCLRGPLVRGLVGDASIFEDLVQHHKREFYAQCRREELHEVQHCLTTHVGSTHEVAGLERLHRFEDLLENGFRTRNHLFGRDFTRAVVGTMADWIMGKDWERYGPELIRERHWYNRSKGVVANAPRRFGKTMVTAKVEAVTAAVMEGSVQNPYSPGQRASVLMLNTIYKLVLELGLGDKIVKYNQETLWLKFGQKDDPLAPISKIYCFPSNPKISTSLCGTCCYCAVCCCYCCCCCQPWTLVPVLDECFPLLRCCGCRLAGSRPPLSCPVPSQAAPSHPISSSSSSHRNVCNSFG